MTCSILQGSCLIRGGEGTGVFHQASSSDEVKHPGRLGEDAPESVPQKDRLHST